MPNLHIDLNGKTDGELLALVAQHARNAHLANAAFRVFYSRHVRYVFYFCKSRFANPKLANADDEASIADLVQETFLRAFEKAHTFIDDVSDAVATQASGARERQTRGWLCRIAENLFKDRLRRSPSLKTERFYDGEEECLIDESATALEESDTPSPESLRMRLLKVALKMLSEREQDILRVVYQWYEPNKKLPSSVIDDLTTQHQTTRENIRKILSRARKRIEHTVVALLWLSESERNLICDAGMLCDLNQILSAVAIETLATHRQVPPADLSNILSDALSKVREFVKALEMLPKRDQAILCATYRFYEPNKELPDFVTKELTTQYQIEPADIVKIATRAIEKIEMAIAAHGKSKIST